MQNSPRQNARLTPSNTKIHPVNFQNCKPPRPKICRGASMACVVRPCESAWHSEGGGEELTPSLTKRLTFTRSLASQGAGTIIAGRKCTEDERSESEETFERSESEGTFERSENPKGAQACASAPRQNAGHLMVSWQQH